MSVDDGLRPIFRSYLIPLGFDMQSVETGGTGRGIPDTNYCTGGLEGWIEFKATSGWSVDLSPEQIGWIERRVRHGGRVWIAVRRRHEGGARRGGAVDELYLLPGKFVRDARLNGLRGANLGPHLMGPFEDGPSRWDWDTVAEALRR